MNKVDSRDTVLPAAIPADTIVVECVVAALDGDGWHAGQSLHWQPALAGLEQQALEN
ncbi:MAG: hypothetical protein J6T92_07145 [Ottowia sp.]|nr:hypothetical protein [Ottowia sp.]